MTPLTVRSSLLSLVLMSACGRTGLQEVNPQADCPIKLQGTCVVTALVMDLAGDGIRFASAAAKGLRAAAGPGDTNWRRWDDGVLVHDVDGTGRIEDASEIFGNSPDNDNGFLSLAAFDDTGDYRLDRRDPIFAQLMLWQDFNGDEQATNEELIPLEKTGIEAIELEYTEQIFVDQYGNRFRQTAHFRRQAALAQTLGPVGMIADVQFILE